MNTTGSHDCGTGRNSRIVWGSREDCDRCKQADAQFKAAQEFYRKDVITYTDGTQGRVNQDGIIEDVCNVNTLLGTDRVYTEVV